MSEINFSRKAEMAKMLNYKLQAMQIIFDAISPEKLIAKGLVQEQIDELQNKIQENELSSEDKVYVFLITNNKKLDKYLQEKDT